MKIRLNKFLAENGVASRRGADALIADGKVMVNGSVVKEMGVKVEPGKDTVSFNGRVISAGSTDKEYWMVNKPKGVVSTTKDPQRRKEVTRLVKSGVKLYPVGRLDEDSEGLIILTNDGDLAYQLTHPKYEIKKVYEVKIQGTITEGKMEKLRRGVNLREGMTARAEVEELGHNRLQIVIHEGRKRQVRRMCSKVGLEVVKLVRVKMGSLELGDLETGESRRLSQAELNELKKVGEQESAGGDHN